MHYQKLPKVLCFCIKHLNLNICPSFKQLRHVRNYVAVKQGASILKYCRFIVTASIIHKVFFRKICILMKDSQYWKISEPAFLSLYQWTITAASHNVRRTRLCPEMSALHWWSCCCCSSLHGNGKTQDPIQFPVNNSISGISGGVYCKNMQSKKGSYVGLIWLSKLETIICLCSDIYGVDFQLFCWCVGRQTLVVPRLYLCCHHGVDIFGFARSILNNYWWDCREIWYKHSWFPEDEF